MKLLKQPLRIPIKKILCRCHSFNYRITELMRSGIDNKATGQACFVDLQKAFEMLDHSILLVKLERYGY